MNFLLGLGVGLLSGALLFWVAFELLVRRRLRRHNDTLRQKLAQADAEIADLRPRLRIASGRAARARRKADQATAQVQALRREKEMVAQELRFTRENVELRRELGEAQSRIGKLESGLWLVINRFKEAVEAQSENRGLRRRLDAAEEDLAALRERVETQEASPGRGLRQQQPIPGTSGNLQLVKGIGATYAKRLREAGVTTLAELAELTPEEAQELTGAAGWRVDTRSWINQARELTGMSGDA